MTSTMCNTNQSFCLPSFPLNVCFLILLTVEERHSLMIWRNIYFCDYLSATPIKHRDDKGQILGLDEICAQRRKLSGYISFPFFMDGINLKDCRWPSNTFWILSCHLLTKDQSCWPRFLYSSERNVTEAPTTRHNSTGVWHPRKHLWPLG